MKVKLDSFAYLPTRAHDTDAGMDLKSPKFTIVPPHSFRSVRTGVHIQLPHGKAGLIVSKSGLMTNHGITSHGLIDEGYSGEIVVTLFNQSDTEYRVHQGDKISQLVIIPVSYETVELVERIVGGSRGTDGFGSTGR